MAVSEAPVVWDLSDLYSGLDDPRIQADLDRIRANAAGFEATYKGRISGDELTPALLREALDEYERINRERARPLGYASLMFSADTSDPACGALLQKVQVESTSISSHLIFFDLEIGKIPEVAYQEVVADPALDPYRHYLHHERSVARHHLSEPEEKIASELSNTGGRAFVRLFSEVTSRATFRVELNGETRELNQSQTLALLYDPDRTTRLAAADAVTRTLQGLSHVLTYIYNNLLLEKQTMDRLRSHDYPEQARHESNELEPEVVQNVVDVCRENFGIVADYYRMKGRLLGVEELTHVDRYAPISEGSATIPFNEARRMVLDAFERFDPRMRTDIDPFFTKNWIDAEVRDGKRGGAFCSYVAPDVHPYVFMNYTGRTRDVMTLAHELGHALHGVLASDNNFLSFYPSLPMAETASVFAEMLVFEQLQQEITDPREQFNLLTSKIEDTIATVFRQISMFRFEQAAHAARREHGELTTDRYSALWQSNMQEMFGDSLALGEGHAWWWLYIPHIYATPFYVYAYSFGELLVLALYARYKQEGQLFVQRYFDLLATGSSQSPAEMLQVLGIDISRREFWQGGVDLIRDMVNRAITLSEQLA